MKLMFNLIVLLAILLNGKDYLSNKINNLSNRDSVENSAEFLRTIINEKLRDTISVDLIWSTKLDDSMSVIYNSPNQILNTESIFFRILYLTELAYGNSIKSNISLNPPIFLYDKDSNIIFDYISINTRNIKNDSSFLDKLVFVKKANSIEMDLLKETYFNWLECVLENGLDDCTETKIMPEGYFWK